MGSPEKNETMAYVLVTIMIVVIVLIVTCCCWIWYDLLDCKSYLEDRKQERKIRKILKKAAAKAHEEASRNSAAASSIAERSASLVVPSSANFGEAGGLLAVSSPPRISCDSSDKNVHIISIKATVRNKKSSGNSNATAPRVVSSGDPVGEPEAAKCGIPATVTYSIVRES